MPAPTLLVIPSSLDEGASAADVATATAVRDALVAAALAAGFTRASITVPEWRQLVLRYTPRLPAGLDDKGRDAAYARMIRADYPADALLLVGLSRDTAGAPTLEAVMATTPATGDGRIERRATKYDTLTAADPIPDAVSVGTFVSKFVEQQLPALFAAANTAVNGSGPPAPPAPPPGPPKPPKKPDTEVETARPAWHIPVAVGGGVVGGLLLGLLIASAMRGSKE